MVQRLVITLAPSQMSYLATSQLLIDSFPHMKELKELVMHLLTSHHHWTDHLFPLTELISSHGIACCISNLTYTIYSSPSPMTADLFERGLNETRSIFIHKSLNQDLQNFLQLATNNVDVTDVIVTKFTGFEEVEEHLTKLMQIAIVREAEDNEDVLEEEVKAANQLLNLLADWDRRGSLLCVMLCKVAFSK